jgi:hypothetical protein
VWLVAAVGIAGGRNAVEGQADASFFLFFFEDGGA